MNSGATPLHLAFVPGLRVIPGPDIAPDVVETLLAAGADPNAADEHGRTPLHDAAVRVDENTLEALRMLVEAGENPHAHMEDPRQLPRRPTSHTPLTIARELGHTEAAAILLKTADQYRRHRLPRRSTSLTVKKS
ncbi:ankyrin repeat domain-containing protein [Embleya sp. NPDC127516]|uniref:ankyrin repeat domain-containing protein n=1 Tax=Embleya sp. NPDC127516 TaxID=3363990 RepID=UPI00381A645B